MDGTIAEQERRPQRVREPSRDGRSDVELVRAVAGGDRLALAEVFRREGGRILAVARAVCGADAADDVAQDVLVALWRRPDRFDPARGTLRSFLLLQARSRATDALRSDGARSARERTAGTTDQARHRSRSRLVEDEVLQLLDGEEVQRLLRLLPGPEREAIALAYYGGLAYHEVATALGRPEGTVKSQIRAGLARLRAELLDRADGDRSRRRR